MPSSTQSALGGPIVRRAPALRILLVSLLLVGSALTAGCAELARTTSAEAATSAPAAIPADWAERALPDLHNHMDINLHKGLTTSNFQVLGWNGMVSPTMGRTAGGFLCGGAAERDDGRRLAIAGSFITDVAFAVADVTDPANPQNVGEYRISGGSFYDAAITPDGMHVVVAYQSFRVPLAAEAGALPLTTPTLSFVDACTGEERILQPPTEKLAMQPGIILVGVQDPANPTFEDFFPSPGLGPHSVSTGEADGAQYAVASITNLAHAGSYFEFFRVLDTPVGGRLVSLGVYDAAAHTGRVATLNGHVDASIQKHPITGQTLAYLADWDSGMVIVDLSVPGAIVPVGTWADKYSSGSYNVAAHGTVPIQGTWDGKHYTIVGQEFGDHPIGRPTGWIYVVDTTNPAAPKEVGRWTLPVDVEWGGGFRFSTHYFDLVGRTLFVSMYHGGLWAVDLSTPAALATPLSIGVFVPENVSPKPPQSNREINGAPYVCDVFPLPNGDIAVFDASAGVYVVRFDAANPAPAPTPWPRPGPV